MVKASKVAAIQTPIELDMDEEDYDVTNEARKEDDSNDENANDEEGNNNKIDQCV